MRREIIRKTRTSCTRQIFALVVKISAFTLKVTNMARSVHFYNEILGLAKGWYKTAGANP